MGVRDLKLKFNMMSEANKMDTRATTIRIQINWNAINALQSKVEKKERKTTPLDGDPYTEFFTRSRSWPCDTL